MKTWQKGYPIEFLKALSAIFKAELKPYTYGAAFGLPNEQSIADALSTDSFAYTKEMQAACFFSVLKTQSRHADFTGTRQAAISPGELFIKVIAGEPHAKGYLIETLARKTKAPAVWIEAHVESPSTMNLLQESNQPFLKVLTKITAASAIKGLFVSGEPALPLPAELPLCESVGLKLLPVGIDQHQHMDILAELRSFEASRPAWAQHYSNYNKRQSWTAFALKGFDKADPGFIIKPAEMSKAWKAEHPEMLSATCRLTDAAPAFPRTLAIIQNTLQLETQRVRFMRLKANGGELTRHADITDPEAGVADGAVARLHIPIKTAPGCFFRSWDAEGFETRRHFKERQLFYLDTRKPHAVLNESDSERIHLVIDAFSNQKLREMLGA